MPGGYSRRILLALAVGLMTLQAPVSAHAQSSGDVDAEECCLTLLFPVGARALALGNALTARQAPDGLFINPAAVANLSAGEVRVHSARTDIETSTGITALFGVSTAGTLAFSYRLVDYGDIESTDEQGNATGHIRLTDQALYATFATEAVRGVRGGVTYTLFQFRNDCSGVCGEPPFQATTHAVDVGIQVKPGWTEHLELGAALNHVGQRLQVHNAPQASNTPARARVGAAYELLHLFSSDTATSVWGSVDIADSWHRGVEPQVSAALELALDRTIFVRSSWASGTGRGTGAAVGLGLMYDRFDISVAKAFVGAEQTAPIQVSVAVRF